MPSRSDLYAGLSKLLLAAGCATIVRGAYAPEDESYAGTMFPVASYVENEREQIEPASSDAATRISGAVSIMFYVETGVPSSDGMGGGEAGYKKLDDLHDAVIVLLENYFPQYFSNTTTVYPESWEVWWWYRSKDLPFVAAEMRIHFDMSGPGH